MSKRISFRRERVLHLLTILGVGLVFGGSLAAQDFLDGKAIPSHQEFGMHVCPAGSAMGGANVSKNVFLCRSVDETQQDSFVDYGSQRKGMHACPGGSYMRGLQADKNELLCSFDKRAGNSNVTGEKMDAHGATQGFSMHICGGNDVMTGIENSANSFLCASKSPKFAASTLPVTAQDPAQPRNFLKSPNATIQERAAWQFATWNWLAHILAVSQVKGYQPPASGGAPSRHVPAPPLPSISQPVQIEGTQQFLLRYASPVDGSQEQAYLILPPNYSSAHRYPAVLVTHGHDDACKDSLARNWNDADHAAALYFAQQGAIALAPDTRSFCAYQTASQGGRSHDDFTAGVRLGTLPQEYLLDNLVRVSYLASRKDVDTSQIFTAGLSLGAYQAMWTAAMDDRISKVVVGDLFLDLKCLNSSASNHECQTIPAISTDYLRLGGDPGSGGFNARISQPSLLIDTADLAALIAPRPLLVVWGQADPFFTNTPDCATKAATEAAEVYGAFGKATNFQRAEIVGMAHNFEDYTSARFLLGSAAPRRDYGTQRDGFHACNADEGMVGIHASNNQFLCQKVVGPLSCSVDSGSHPTERNGMHACPAGSFMQGADVGGNSFLCCKGPNAMSVDERVDAGSQTEGMHACPPVAGALALMTGLQNAKNQLSCGSVK